MACSKRITSYDNNQEQWATLPCRVSRRFFIKLFLVELLIFSVAATFTERRTSSGIDSVCAQCLNAKPDLELINSLFEYCIIPLPRSNIL